MRIYVASSWRNEYQPAVVEDLRKAGHEVYDFRNPPGGLNGFGWREVDPEWQRWTPRLYIEGLKHQRAVEGFTSDFRGMEWAECCVLVLPSGRSAHIEAGWFVGQGRPLFVLIPPDMPEPELMYLLAGDPDRQLHQSMISLLEALGTPWIVERLRAEENCQFSVGGIVQTLRELDGSGVEIPQPEQLPYDAILRDGVALTALECGCVIERTTGAVALTMCQMHAMAGVEEPPLREIEEACIEEEGMVTLRNAGGDVLLEVPLSQIPAVDVPAPGAVAGN